MTSSYYIYGTPTQHAVPALKKKRRSKVDGRLWRPQYFSCCMSAGRRDSKDLHTAFPFDPRQKNNLFGNAGLIYLMERTRRDLGPGSVSKARKPQQQGREDKPTLISMYYSCTVGDGMPVTGLKRLARGWWSLFMTDPTPRSLYFLIIGRGG